MINVTREYLIKYGICPQGLADFDHYFPDGVATEDQFIEKAYELDERDGDTLNSTWSRQVVVHIKQNSDIVWIIYNPQTNQEEQFNTKEECVARQTEIIQNMTYDHASDIYDLYHISIETINNGNGTMEIINANDL